jgi:hypothetical protein
MNMMEISLLLARKEGIDKNNKLANNMNSYDMWLANAVELLLRAELERQKHGHPPR